MTKMLKENDFFKTTDINLHASLIYYGYATEAIDMTNAVRAVFLTKRDDQLDLLIQKYFAHKLSVEPLAFATILKELKTRLYHS